MRIERRPALRMRRVREHLANWIGGAKKFVGNFTSERSSMEPQKSIDDVHPGSVHV